MHNLLVVKRVFGVLVFAAAVLFGTRTGSAAERLMLQISPTISMAPAFVLIRAIVEHNDDNRRLEIVADSGDFYRRTVIDLDGANSPVINELKLQDIPGGEYDVLAVLYDAHGNRTIVRKTLMVSSSLR